MLPLSGYLVERTCPICGKYFYPTSMWVYHKEGVKTQPLVCSYTCAKVGREEKEARKRKKKKA